MKVTVPRPLAGLHPRWAALLLAVALGSGAFLALTGFLHFLLVLAGLASRWTALLAVAVALAVVIVVFRPCSETSNRLPATPSPWRWTPWLAAVLAVALVLIISAQVSAVSTAPFGEWDAFSIWNLRARFLAGPGEVWKFAISPLVQEMHPDYPPLLSSAVAGLWRATGTEGSPAIPAAVSLVFFWSTFALLAALLGLLRGAPAAVFAGLVLVATTSFLEQSTWQYADIPLGFFFLAALGLLALASVASEGSRPLLLSAGAFAGFASLVKDEGIPFLIAAFVCYFVLRWRAEPGKATLTSAAWWLAGALPSVLLLAVFKLFIAPIIGPLRGQTAGLVDKLTDPGRYGTIASESFSQLLLLGDGITHPLILIAILAFALRFAFPARLRLPVLSAGITLVLMLGTYVAVYLITPDDLTWRLQTSLLRLYTQLWPSLTFVFFLALAVPHDPPADTQGTERHKKRRRKKREDA